MKKIFILILVAFTLTSSTYFTPPESYDIKEFYKAQSLDSGILAIDSYGEAVEVQKLLFPTNLEIGEYEISISKSGDNLYKVESTNFYIKTLFCLELAFYEDVILIVESNNSYFKGKIIFSY